MTSNYRTIYTKLFTSLYVFSRSLFSNHASIKQLLYSQLIQALSNYPQKPEVQCTEVKQIPLYKVRNNSKILYVSGLAQQLSKSHNCTAMHIADTIASQLSATSSDVFSVKIVPPGWIHLELTHSSLAIWLQNLAFGCIGEEEKIGKGVIPKSQNQNPAIVFTMQYVHARCCSLVLLAHREGLIKLREPLPGTSPVFWQLICQESIPWLNHHQQLRLHHPSEEHLIAQLVQIVDDLVGSDASDVIKWQKVGWELSQAWENFWSQCRIWGEVKVFSLELAQARLGLVMATQKLLRLLLVGKLGVDAPLEL